MPDAAESCSRTHINNLSYSLRNWSQQTGPKTIFKKPKDNESLVYYTFEARFVQDLLLSKSDLKTLNEAA